MGGVPKTLEGSPKSGILRSLTSGSKFPLLGNKPPALVPSKGKYLTNDIKLLGQHVQVPIRMPKDFFSVILEKGKGWDTGGDSK